MALFSQQMLDGARADFAARLARCGPGGRDIRARLDALEASSPDTAAAARWLYASSPLSDWANYGFELFLSCAAHGVFLRERSPYAREVPEDIFLNYVLHIRVNEEELCDCRRLFHDCLAPRLQGRAPREAVIEVNYWNAEQVTYQSTDSRTRSALAIYQSASGRCGEESTFAVNAFRAVGIPARQIYTPRWAHCDDNHAWVEVWVDGGWHFLGACEPEETLDRGWFTSAASRAMVIHSRRFGSCGGGEEVISQAGAAAFLNHLSRYAETRTLTVRVTDPSGAAAAGAEVTFSVLNMSEFFPAAVMTTGRDGTARLTCGLGSVCVRVRKDGVSCERMVYTPEEDTVEIPLEQETPALDTWEDFAAAAPRDRIIPAAQPSEEQKALGREKAAAAAGKRARRQLDISGADRFLADGSFSMEEKASLLATLSRKDQRDVDPAVLREALEVSGEYNAGDGLFYPYVACPRVWDEPLRTNRRFILDFLSREQKEAFRKHPREILDFIRAHVRYDPAAEYGQIVTLPVGALATGSGSPLSQKLLFVSICRALGIPARLNPVDQQPEYWDAGRFRGADAPEESCAIVFEKGPEESWQYWTDFAAGVLEDGAYRTLELSHLAWDGGRLAFPARPGDYRVITDNRLPNGDLFASKYHFRLEAGETKAVRLRKYQADLSRMLDNFALEEFTVTGGDGQAVSGSGLTASRAVLLWLEEGAEPTEHILNELLERREDFLRLPANIIFLVRGPAALENARLRQTLEAFPDIQVCYDSFVPNVETIARRMYVDPEKLPLIVVTTKPLNAVYASSGYNVGSSDMILKVCGAELA